MTGMFDDLEAPQLRDAAALAALAVAFAWFDAHEYEVTEATPPGSWVRRARNPSPAWIRNFASTLGARQAARFLAALRRLDDTQIAAIGAAVGRRDA